MTEEERRLSELGFELPSINPPAANYIPYRIHDNLLFISGQTCKWDGVLLYTGAVGSSVSLEEGVKAAELCALNLLLQAKNALEGRLDRISACLRLGGFVQAGPNFAQHPQVIDGASNLIAAVLGERGMHTRAAVGCSSLPGNASVEVDALFAVKN